MLFYNNGYVKIVVARTVYWHTLAHEKLKHILRFENHIFCFEIGLSPLGLIQSQNKIYTLICRKFCGFCPRGLCPMGI